MTGVKYIIPNILLLIIVFCTGTALAGEPNVYTDQDLENYKSTGRTLAPPQEPQRTSDILHEIDEKNNKEWWCEKGKEHARYIKDAKEDVEEAEEKLNKKRHDNLFNYRYKDSYGESAAEERLKHTKKQLEKVEEDFRDFEEKAQRLNIPLGWLRCDFE